MKLFGRKNGSKRWREKARMIDPHKTRITLMDRNAQELGFDLELWMEKKLSEPENAGTPSWISRAELAFASRVRQENSLSSSSFH